MGTALEAFYINVIYIKGTLYFNEKFWISVCGGNLRETRLDRRVLLFYTVIHNMAELNAIKLELYIESILTIL